jgi:hypothetical protein
MFLAILVPSLSKYMTKEKPSVGTLPGIKIKIINNANYPLRFNIESVTFAV